ncbi:MAG: aldo/keto reductase [Lachnospiraceae bacterium]|nr:aldo/keto reductase [Lachnospiraceae bacterium]
MSIDLGKMPKLGFGMMRLPEKDGTIDIDHVCRMVDACLQAGMTYFDSAYVYHGGNSESVGDVALYACFGGFLMPAYTTGEFACAVRLLSDQLH